MIDVLSSTMTGSAVSSAAKSSSNSTPGQPAIQEGNASPVGRDRLPPQKASAESLPPLSPADMRDLVNQANESFSMSTSNLKFSVAEGTDINVIRIEDAETGELIRQIPSEEMVAIARALKDQQQGMMLKERV